MATSDSVNWDDEVMKERAKIHAHRYPNPPLSSGATVIVVVLGATASLVACAAWLLVILI